jgi:hypothetical protein
LDFVDTVVTNIFSVAKQAGSTAKAIFHTLQAFDEVLEKDNLFDCIRSYILLANYTSNSIDSRTTTNFD